MSNPRLTPLVEALKAFFAQASNSDGDLSRTAQFTLDHVQWAQALTIPDAISHPIVDAYLEGVCAHSGNPESATHELAQVLLAASDQLNWRASFYDPALGPDVVAFSRKFTATSLIGPGGILPCEKVSAGFSLQGPDTYYPPHAHRAEESYWTIGGSGDWRVATKPWFAVTPGKSIFHASGARHAMQTNEQALLSLWLWTSHLDSEVVIVRS